MDGKKKRETRQLADTAAFFHFNLGEIDYETLVGLYLNLDRVKMQWQNIFREAMAMFHTSEPLPLEYFDAICRYEEEAAEVAFDVNAQREMSRIMTECGVRG